MEKQLQEISSFDLQTLDVLLDSIATDATQPEIPRKDFYKNIAQKLHAGTGSLSSIVWVSDGKSQLRIAGHCGWKSLEDRQKSQLQALIRQLIASESTNALAENTPFGRVYANKCQPSNGFAFVYLLLRPIGDSELLGQVFQDLTAEVVGQIEIYENSRKAKTKDESAHEISYLAQMVQNAGKSTSLKQLAFHLVNDLSKVSKADRVTYLDNTGKIRAISGAALVSHKTSVVRNLTRLGKLVLSTRTPIDWHRGEINFSSRRLPRNSRQLIEESGSPTGYILPCEHNQRLFGSIVFEFFDDAEHSVEQRRLVGEAVQFCGPVVARTSQYSSIPGIRFQNFIFNRLFNSPVRLICWLAMASVAFWLGWYLLFAVQRPFLIYGEGSLEPVRKQHVFARTDGEIKNLLIEQDANVEFEQKLLVIESRQLEKELIDVEGEIAEVQQQLRNLALTEAEGEAEDILAEEARRASEEERLKIRLRGLENRLSFFEERQGKLKVVAPLEGIVVTPDLRRRLVDRPVNRGDLLMTIAQTNGEWHIELNIPDNRIEFIEKAIKDNAPEPLSVEFRLMSDSTKTWVGELKEFEYRSSIEESNEDSQVKAIVSISEDELQHSLRLGAKVFGKIECGKKNNFFLLTYEIRNRIREWFFW